MKEQRRSSGSEIGESERPNFVSLLEKIEKGENLSRQEEADFWNLLGNKIRRMASFQVARNRENLPFPSEDADDFLGEVVQRVFYSLVKRKGDEGDGFAVVRDALKRDSKKEGLESKLHSLLFLKLHGTLFNMWSEREPHFFDTRKKVLRYIKSKNFLIFSPKSKKVVSFMERRFHGDVYVLPPFDEEGNSEGLPESYSDEDLELLSLNPSGKEPTQRDIVDWFFEEEEKEKREKHVAVIVEIIFQALRKHPEYRQFISLFVLCKAVQEIRKGKEGFILETEDGQDFVEKMFQEKMKNELYETAINKIFSILEDYPRTPVEEKEGVDKRIFLTTEERELCKKIIKTRLQYFLGLEIDEKLPLEGMLDSKFSFSRLYASFTGEKDGFKQRKKEYRESKIRAVVEYLWKMAVQEMERKKSVKF